MPPIRTNKRSASPEEPSSFPFAYPSYFTFGTPLPASSVQLHSPLGPSPPFNVQDASLSPAPKKKRSHGKARPPGHIPRPPNAFIIFRTDYIRSMATHSTPEMSKNLGNQWKKMSAPEKWPWEEKARIAAEEHKKMYPDYRYKPIHPRDAQGRCIRKPRKPKQPRVKNVPNDPPYPWAEKKSDTEFPNSSLPSNASSASSPLHSPSPAPFTALAQHSYQIYRRSSSVPLPGCDDRFFAEQITLSQPSGSANPFTATGTHACHISRKLSKRPSTSMDFTYVGSIESYPQNNTYLDLQGDSSQWRPVHRRSSSAPMFIGESPSLPALTQGYPHTGPLTPINPAYSDVFDRFSWNAPSSAQHPTISTIVPPMHPYTGLDIPQMTHSPLSNGSATPPAATPDISPSPITPSPAIQHPAPISTFDFSAFQAQMGEFDVPPHTDATFTSETFGNALEFVPQPFQHVQLYPHPGDQQLYPVEQQQTVQYPDGNQQPSPAESSYSPAAEVHTYEDGLRYTRPAHSLAFNELIVEGY